MTSRNHHLFRFSRNRRNCNFNCYNCCTGYGRVRLHATKSWRRASHLWLPTSRSNPRRPWPCGLQRQACLPPSVQTRDHTHSTLTSLTLQRPKNHTYGLSLPVRRSVLYRVASARIRHTVKSPCRPFAFFALPPCVCRRGPSPGISEDTRKGRKVIVDLKGVVSQRRLAPKACLAMDFI